MTGANRMSVSRTTKANPSTVFALVCDPEVQVKIDGSGMLQAAPKSSRLQAVGDEFVVDMDRESLGDLPMGKYKVLNTVTRIVPDALLEWNVGSREHGPYGHVYGWEISALGTGETEVTNYCDWTDIPEQARDRFPIVPERMMQRTVENLVALLAQP